MKSTSKNLKVVLGIFYLIALFIVLYFLFSFVDVRDLTSYEFIRLNKETIINYKTEKFFFLLISFFIFSIVWILLLGFAAPLLLFAGFVFGKWWGLVISLISITIGATLLYLLAKLFFSEIIKQKLENKFIKFNKFFKKNELFYFILYRFFGGGGIPYGIQNVLPVLFNISTKNYFLGTFVGSGPPMFITIALGEGLENFIDKNEKLNFFNLLTMPDIYLPILGLIIIVIATFFVKKIYFNKTNE